MMRCVTVPTRLYACICQGPDWRMPCRPIGAKRSKILKKYASWFRGPPGIRRRSEGPVS